MTPLHTAPDALAGLADLAAAGAPHATELLCTQPPAPGAGAWLEARRVVVPKPMRVQVRLPGSAQQVYEALFGHTFDAYDDALERYPMALRIEVTVLPCAAQAQARVRGVA